MATSSDQGNAVTAEWVGPSGHQLWNGMVLNPGTVVEGVGFDEANGSPYWKVLTGKDLSDSTVDGTVGALRFDPGAEARAAAEAEAQAEADAVKQLEAQAAADKAKAKQLSSGSGS